MHWPVDISDPGTFVTLLIGVILLMRQLAAMDRFQELRVLVLTLLLSWFVFYFFLTSGFTEPVYPTCEPQHFCMTEM